jgi:phosphorylcholine metabolism protein LicD
LKDKLHTYGLTDSENRYTGLNPKFEIVYVQPSNYKNEINVIYFEWISNWLKSKYPNAEFENEFADALLLWGKD